MQYSIHSPNEFIQSNLEQLLPDWLLPVLSVLVVLQLCQFALVERTIDQAVVLQKLAVFW